MARHLYRCPLRWADMDAFGHVNNVAFLRYLEEARIDFMFRLAPGGGSASFSGGSVVARHEIDYLRPLVHRHEPVLIESWVTSMRGASMTIAYEVKDEAPPSAGEALNPGSSDSGTPVIYARAATVVVPFNLETQRPRRITDEERSFLAKYLEEDGSDTYGRDAAGGRRAARR